MAETQQQMTIWKALASLSPSITESIEKDVASVKTMVDNWKASVNLIKEGFNSSAFITNVLGCGQDTTIEDVYQAVEDIPLYQTQTVEPMLEGDYVKVPIPRGYIPPSTSGMVVVNIEQLKELLSS